MEVGEHLLLKVIDNRKFESLLEQFKYQRLQISFRAYVDLLAAKYLSK